MLCTSIFSLRARGIACRGISTAKSATEDVEYLLRVVTGDRRGAATRANVMVTLRGDRGSLQLPLNKQSVVHGHTSEESFMFARNSESLHSVRARDIGTLQQVVVEHDGSKHGSGWFLSQIGVERRDLGEQWVFPCNEWLGDSEDGGLSGPTSRKLDVQMVALETVKPARKVAHPLVLKVAAMATPKVHLMRQGVKAKIGQALGWAGEDAYMLARSPDGTCGAIGVADGVAHWATKGIDAGLFARKLMSHSSAVFNAPRTDRQLTAAAIMDEAWMRLSSEPTRVEGSSTVSIALFNPLQGVVEHANIGDSGLMIIRNSKTIYRSPHQELYFQCPYQLGHDSRWRPADAYLASIEVEEGDHLVMGTDGLFDNLHEEEIIKHVEYSIMAQKSIDAVAYGIAEEAHYSSIDRTKDTPYGRGLYDAYGATYYGGKIDDITVIVGKLVKAR